MSGHRGHNAVRKLLPLAAAGALSDAELQALEEHLRVCPECSAQLEQWRTLAADLRAVPTPSVPAAVAERTRATVAAALLPGRAAPPWMMALVVVTAWGATLLGWPLAHGATSAALEWLHLGWNATWTGLALYAAAGWLTAGAAGAVLVAHARTQERTR